MLTFPCDSVAVVVRNVSPRLRQVSLVVNDEQTEVTDISIEVRYWWPCLFDMRYSSVHVFFVGGMLVGFSLPCLLL